MTTSLNRYKRINRMRILNYIVIGREREGSRFINIVGCNINSTRNGSRKVNKSNLDLGCSNKILIINRSQGRITQTGNVGCIQLFRRTAVNGWTRTKTIISPSKSKEGTERVGKTTELSRKHKSSLLLCINFASDLIDLTRHFCRTTGLPCSRRKVMFLRFLHRN
jgi:hypothetical protein